MAEPGNPVALCQSLVQGTSLPETMSESSDLLMQCEEESLNSCQNNNDSKNEGSKANGNRPNSAASAGAPAASAAAEVPARDMRAALPTVSATGISPALIPQILQQMQVVSSASPSILPGVGTTSQPLIIASPNMPVTNTVGSTMPKTIGFILNGRTYLTGAGQQLIAPKIGPPAPGPTMQVPVTITLTGPSGIQTVSAMATTGFSQLNLSPAPLANTSVVTPAVPVSTSTPAASGALAQLPFASFFCLPKKEKNVGREQESKGEGVSSQQLQPKPPTTLISAPVNPSPQPTPVANAVPVAPAAVAPAAVAPAAVAPAVAAPTAAAPATAAPLSVAPVKVDPVHRPPPPPPPPPLSPPAPSTSTFQLRAPASRSKAFQTCPHCRYSYEMVASLRGYMCMCNAHLRKAIQDAKPKKKKAKPAKNPEQLLGGSFRSPRKAPASSSRLSMPSQGSSEEDDDDDDDDDNEEDDERRPPTRRRRPQHGHTDEDAGGGGKLIILVEDFYYGVYRGVNADKRTPENAIPFKCHLCDKKLKNNLKMMVHTKHHVEMDQQYEAETQTTCQHCFRSFASPLTLQFHVESVHSQAESSTKCRICELAYENEPVFLQHMKSTHKPGEMPYICQVCGFRSSFYLDVIFHFRDLHSNTTHLLCPYCLKVFRCSSSYQLHYSRHQKKSVFHCDKCRLQFLFMKEKTDHKQMHHITHRTPRQLEGLKPGTRVTIRTYAALPPGPAPGHSEDDAMSMPPPLEPMYPESEPTPSTSTAHPVYPERHPTPTRSITPVSPSPISPKRFSPKVATPNREEAYSAFSPTPVTPPQTTTTSPLPTPIRKIPCESLHVLMTEFEKQWSASETDSCIECTFEIPSYVKHFPTYVNCSLCRYKTCCSRSYANHMISNHVSRKTGQFSKYLSMFRPCQKGAQLYCLSCDYTTDLGDAMANHLVENPEHEGSSPKAREGFSGGYKRFLIIPSRAMESTQSTSSVGGPSPSSTQRASGVTSHEATRPSAATLQLEKLFSESSLPVKTERSTAKKLLLNGAEGGQSRKEGACLSPKQLKTVLFALCWGVPQAAARFQTQPALIQAWLLDRKSQGPSKGCSGLGPHATDKLAEWVLAQREQQLAVDEETLFEKAKESVGGSDPGLGQDWAADFLLQHQLGVQQVGTGAKTLPQSVEEGVRSFARFMKKQVGGSGPSFSEANVGAVDELTVFIDLGRLDKTSNLSSAFLLTDSGMPLMDIVLSAMADGTLLPAMVFLKGNSPACTAAVPASVFLEAKPEGFSDEERLELWLAKVWRPYINPGGGGKGLLVMDPYRGHLDDDFLASLNSANTLPAVVPKACSCSLQPLEACSGPVLREFLQACWSQQVSSAPESLVGAQADELALLLISWLTELLQVLSARPDLLQRSFKTVLQPRALKDTSEGQDTATSLVQELTTALLQSNPLEVDVEGDGEEDEDAM